MEAKAYLKATETLYDEWVKRTKAEALAEGIAKGEAQGLAEGMVVSLTSIHERRFGAMPPRLRTALAKKVSLDSLGAWLTLFMSASSAKEIASAIRKGKPAG